MKVKPSVAKKPHRLGRGWTPLWIFICLSKEAFDTFLAEHDLIGVMEWDDFNDAWFNFFPATEAHSAMGVICLRPEYLAITSAPEVVGMISHEATHAKQFCWKVMGGQPDAESEAYYIQGVTLDTWYFIEANLVKEN